MQYSRYNYIHSFKGNPVIFNTLRNTIMQVNDEVSTALIGGNFKRLSLSTIALLVKAGIVVHSNSDEFSEATEQFKLRHKDNGDVSIIVIPTYNCNLQCSYCYAKEATNGAFRPDTGFISEVSRFIHLQLEKHKPDKLTIALFGGEPLLAAAECAEILEKAKHLTEKSGCSLYVTLTTNGAFPFAPVSKLLTFIDSMQVTLDGVGEEHDSRRIRKDGGGTYSSIIRFVNHALEQVPIVTIRYHLHSNESIDNLRADISTLQQDAQFSRHPLLYVAPVGNYPVRTDNSCSSDYQEEWEFKASAQFAREEIISAGWPEDKVFISEQGDTKQPHPSIGCGYLGAWKYLIDLHRDVYFCPVELQNKKMKIGKIVDGGIQFNSNYEKLKALASPPPKCQECEFLP